MGADKGKRLAQRPVRISAWKLAKLDSTEAMRAAAKARASSSVLRPIGARQHPYDADDFCSSNVSGRSSPVSSNQGFPSRNNKAGKSKSSYPPSRASREDSETCGQSLSNFSSPHVSNLAPSPLVQHISSMDHFNPMYQSSANQSPLSVRQSLGHETTVHETAAQAPIRKKGSTAAENSRNSVFWDPEAGRFVSSSSGGAGSSQVLGAELLYTGQSIFFGGPLVNDQLSRGTRTGSSMAYSLDSGSTSSNYQQSRLQRGGQLPVFVPSDSRSQHKQFSSRLP